MPTLDDYIDLEPERVEWGARIVGSSPNVYRYKCGWCGETFVLARGEAFSCPYCPNESPMDRGVIEL